jgi:hypothetical protein
MRGCALRNLALNPLHQALAVTVIEMPWLLRQRCYPSANCSPPTMQEELARHSPQPRRLCVLARHLAPQPQLKAQPCSAADTSAVIVVCGGVVLDVQAQAASSPPHRGGSVPGMVRLLHQV